MFNNITLFPRKVFILLIQIYQIILSPLLTKSCRFEPSCSEYTKQTIKKYGIFRGSYLGIKRISRCHPYSAGGFDPIP